MVKLPDVSGLSIGPNFKGQAVQAWTDWPLSIVPIGSSETSVISQPTLSNNLEEGKIFFQLRRKPKISHSSTLSLTSALSGVRG
jgi:hypothetical protein